MPIFSPWGTIAGLTEGEKLSMLARLEFQAQLVKWLNRLTGSVAEHRRTGGLDPENVKRDIQLLLVYPIGYTNDLKKVVTAWGRVWHVDIHPSNLLAPDEAPLLMERNDIRDELVGCAWGDGYGDTKEELKMLAEESDYNKEKEAEAQDIQAFEDRKKKEQPKIIVHR